MRVYTDGACSGNPGPGGWAWATEDGRSDSGGAEFTTNQRMELQAVLEALRALDGDIEVMSDSTYVVNCFRDEWFKGWIKRGWLNSAKKPVANRDLWEPLIELYLERSRSDDITFEWVKGHSGDRMNDLVDALAVDASMAMQFALAAGTGEGCNDGDGCGGVVEPPPWEIAAAVWLVGVTEPDRDQRARLDAVIDGLDRRRDVIVSGLRRGTELEGAERARRLGVSVAVVLPFADPARNWPPADRQRFDALVEAASHVVTLDGDESAPGKAVEGRNEWIGERVAGAIVVGDDRMAVELDEAGLSVVTV